MKAKVLGFFFPQPVSFPFKLPSVGSLSYKATKWRKANLWLRFWNHNHPSEVLWRRAGDFCRLSNKHLRKSVLRSPTSLVGTWYHGQDPLHGGPLSRAQHGASTRNIQTWLLPSVSVFQGENSLGKHELLYSPPEGHEEVVAPSSAFSLQQDRMRRCVVS